jgi:hypothetical protein
VELVFVHVSLIETNGRLTQAEGGGNQHTMTNGLLNLKPAMVSEYAQIEK